MTAQNQDPARNRARAAGNNTGTRSYPSRTEKPVNDGFQPLSRADRALKLAGRGREYLRKGSNPIQGLINDRVAEG